MEVLVVLVLLAVRILLLPVHLVVGFLVRSVDLLVLLVLVAARRNLLSILLEEQCDAPGKDLERNQLLVVLVVDLAHGVE